MPTETAGATEHRCTVLVVDDDPDVRELLRVALTGDGYHVACVGNGREALDYLRSHVEVCMVLIELRLPVMDAAHFRSIQQRDRALAWIPVVAMSAVVDGDREARRLGARRFLPKPLDVDAVREALRHIGCWMSLRPSSLRL